LQSKQEDAKDASSHKKARQIGEVLGLLEETHRGKEWILQEIKKHGIKIPVKPTMNGYEMLNCCSHDFIATLLDALKGNDIITPDGVQMNIYHWFFSDIVAGSNPSIPTKSQVGKIAALNELILQTQTFKERDSATIILPTGDGQAIGFGDSPEKPLRLAIELHKALYLYNETKRGKEKLLLRIGIESGPVYFVKDLEGKDNVWGPGIITTRRVMDLCGDTQIFAGGRIAEEIVRQSPKHKEVLHLVENYETKYGEKATLYNIYGDGFGNKSAPIKPKKITTNTQRNVKASSNFIFNSIEVMLEITDAKTMDTHHTWLWDVVNISKEPISRIFYYLDGQIPKDFADLNVTVIDGDKNRLEIGHITMNKPYHKEFYIALAQPVLPKQRIKLKLEYDWEEPDRVFSYKFLSGAKRFSYNCMIPKEINLKNRVLKMDMGTGYRVHAIPPSTIKRLNDKTIISWEKSNIVPHDAYEFYW
jgi:hypothetical protein